jgi:hypothetical protein
MHTISTFQDMPEQIFISAYSDLVESVEILA